MGPLAQAENVRICDLGVSYWACISFPPYPSGENNRGFILGQTMPDWVFIGSPGRKFCGRQREIEGLCHALMLPRVIAVERKAIVASKSVPAFIVLLQYSC